MQDHAQINIYTPLPVSHVFGALAQTCPELQHACSQPGDLNHPDKLGLQDQKKVKFILIKVLYSVTVLLAHCPLSSLTNPVDHPYMYPFGSWQFAYKNFGC